MAMDLLDDFPAVSQATLIELARLQGIHDNPRAEEQRGRILHEHRHPDDPHAKRLSVHWDFPYFGAVDTTPQWINLLGAHCELYGLELLDQAVTDRSWVTRTIRDSLVAAVGWLLGRLEDPRGGGFVWVQRAHDYGIANQVWEDSSDSHYHAHGALFDPRVPYAPVAVQGYAYDALLTAADLLERSPGGLGAETGHLRQHAARLRQSLLRTFWQPDLGTFAQAVTIDAAGTLQPARVVASSPGHLLASRILDDDDDDASLCAQRLIARLRAPDLLAAAGIRTKSSQAARFLPGGYHNGSSWPMDTGVIADGLRRWGNERAAVDLEDRILEACQLRGGFPEFFRGDLDGQIRVNIEIVDVLADGAPQRLQQPPQANQGWTATRVWRILRQRG
jgi:glycogen debranching enzyme